MNDIVKPDGQHMWVGAEQGTYCWWCGRSRLSTTPEQCKADTDIMPLYRWHDGSLHGGPEIIGDMRAALDERRAFSWVSTRQVCQHWQAHFAAL